MEAKCQQCPKVVWKMIHKPCQKRNEKSLSSNHNGGQ